MSRASFYILLGGREHRVEVEGGHSLSVSIDGAPYEIDGIPIGDGSYSLLLNGRSYTVGVRRAKDGVYHLSVNGRDFEAQVADELSLRTANLHRGSAAVEVQEIVAPIPGIIAAVEKAVGDPVKDGETVIVLEAMKMFNELTADADGMVERVAVKKGDVVDSGQFLMTIRGG